MAITNLDKPATGVPQTELNIGDGFNLLIGGGYKLIVGAANLLAGLSNSSRPNSGETWSSISGAWVSCAYTWLSASQLFRNATRAIEIDGYTPDGATQVWATYQPWTRTTQSFTAKAGTLDSVRFNIKRFGPDGTGDVRAVLYNHSGTYGVSSVPTGAAIATSDPLNLGSVSTTTLTDVYLYFTGANRVSLTQGTAYCIGFEYSGVGGDNALNTYLDSSSPGHSGNVSEWDGATWLAYPEYDLNFTVRVIPSITNISRPV